MSDLLCGPGKMFAIKTDVSDGNTPVAANPTLRFLVERGNLGSNRDTSFKAYGSDT